MKQILGKYSPEEFAAMFGCDSTYCRPPQLTRDGPLFYNFGSEHQERTVTWLIEFFQAIERMILMVCQENSNFDSEDLKGLQQLRLHVHDLITKTPYTPSELPKSFEVAKGHESRSQLEAAGRKECSEASPATKISC